ncbi:F-box domain-containing protein [Mycena sanguinolenta]|uniref:F-box domain-containing protein n=1 Tax=Mycena sanguinolenta TaxID=230812 RepID=A0A8H6ZDQ3_9AGAR|nr:F-box domain-containing protein [Mycena sanguinolenta]
MSVEELHARIAAIDNEIDSQKKLLAKLENDKSSIQRQLNAVLDPMARLPLEISSEIFLQSIAWPQHAPTSLLQICNAWADIALATPALWTTVHIHFPCSDHFAKVLPIWFERARSRPLSISMSLSGLASNWNHRVSDVVWSHGGHLKHLEILDSDDPTDDGFAFDDESQKMDLFGNATSVSLPLLQTLTIRCQHRREFRASQICQLLCAAPNVVEFISDKVWTGNDPAPENLVVPTLRRVIFGETSSDDEIFAYLTLPALEALSLPMRYISGSELLACVERSAAPLQDLALGWKFGMIESVQLHSCLRLIPTLTRFKIWRPSVQVVTELFVALVDSPSLLPNLRDLTIHLYHADRDPPNLSESSWRTLIRALSTRRVERLYIVPILVSPPMDVLASLRDLVANGAEMHIGTEELNFVVI